MLFHEHQIIFLLFLVNDPCTTSELVEGHMVAFISHLQEFL